MRIEEYKSTIRDDAGVSYKIEACGKANLNGLWEGWLEFYPLRNDLPALRTDRETTQPNRKALEYQATGLEPIYFEGAFNRARVKSQGAEAEKRSLETIERQIFSLFQKRNSPKLLTKEVFDSSSEFANADIVRAFEDLEKKWRFVIRYTRDGYDWISLTPTGASYAGVSMGDEHAEGIPHPPKSSTPPPQAF